MLHFRVNFAIQPRSPSPKHFTASLPSPNQFWLTPFLSQRDRKSTRLNSSHLVISYAVFCLKKKNHTMLRIDRALFQTSDEHVCALYYTPAWTLGHAQREPAHVKS